MIILKEVQISTNLGLEKPVKNPNSAIQLLREAVISEHEATNLYDKIAELILESNLEEKDVIVKTLQEISDEEKAHIGELQKLIAILDKNEIGFYKDGAEEVEEK